MIPQWLVEKVKKFEGFDEVAFWDYKQWTNGYGTKALGPRERITREEAEIRLAHELEKAERYVDNFARIPHEGVRCAMIDLTYNSGTAWESAGLGKLIKGGFYEAAKARLLQYNRAGGKVNKGLTARRKEEASWFDRHD